MKNQDLDRIYLEQVQAYCRLGIYESERLRGQAVIVDVILGIDLTPAVKNDTYENTVSYVSISNIIQDTAKSKEFNLIEHLCGCICNNIFTEHSIVQEIDIKIHKPVINAEGFNGKASVRICRQRES